MDSQKQGWLRLLIAGIYLTTSCSGCFTYHTSPAALNSWDEIQKLDASGKRKQACALALAPQASSADSLEYAAGCIEKSAGGKGVQDKQEDKQGKMLRDAAACGSERARTKLEREGKSLPFLRYRDGDTGILLFDHSPNQCNLEREITTTGWIVSPVAAPIGAAGYAAAGAGVVVAGVAVVAVGAAFVVGTLALFVAAAGH